MPLLPGSVSQLFETPVVLKLLRTEPAMVTRKGRPVSVILPIREYDSILEQLEGFEDLAWLEKVRGKPQSFRPFEEYLADRLKSRSSDSS